MNFGGNIWKKVAIVALIGVVCASCGRKGSLYLPDEEGGAGGAVSEKRLEVGE